VKNDNLAEYLICNKEVKLIIIKLYNVLKKAFLVHNIMNNNISSFILSSFLYSTNIKNDDNQYYLKIDSNALEICSVVKDNGNIKIDVENKDNGNIENGLFKVIKVENNTNFSSSIEINSSSIDDIFTSFLIESDQIMGYIKTYNNYGFMIQVLPNPSKETIDFIKEKTNSCLDFKNVGSIYKHFCADSILLKEKKLHYKCDCNKAKYKQIISTLDKQELLNIKNEDHIIRITCPYCKKQYTFNESEIDKIMAGKK